MSDLRGRSRVPASAQTEPHEQLAALIERAREGRVVAFRNPVDRFVAEWGGNAVLSVEVARHNVEAAVLPLPMPHILLGNTFLTRFQMKRENDTLTLTRRF